MNLIVFLNLVWLMYDADNNDADIISDSEVGFWVVENIFCCVFLAEMLIRFFAFRVKRLICQDCWFVFDALLVFAMVCETWLVLLVIDVLGRTASILKIFKVVRILRMGRMTRLLRSCPELLVLIRGIAIGFRTVFFTLSLLFFIIYAFSSSYGKLQKKLHLRWSASMECLEACPTQ